MGGSSKNTSTNTTTTSLPPEVAAAYQGLMNFGTQVAQQPLQQYGGPMVAGFTPDQTQAFNLIEQSQGMGLPFINQASQWLGSAAQPNTSWTNQIGDWLGSAASGGNPYTNTASSWLGNAAAPVWPNVPQYSGANLAPYMNPYQQSVIDTTMANVQHQDSVAQNNLRGQGVLAGAPGVWGDRAGVAAAELERAQGANRNATLAGLTSAGFNNAQGAFQNNQNLAASTMGADANRQLGAGSTLQGFGQQGAQNQLGAASLLSGMNQNAAGNYMNAAQQMGGLGQLAQTLTQQGAGALLGAGGTQQALAQNQLNIPYQQFQTAQQYPFEIANFLSGLINGTGSQMGGTTTSTQQNPAPSLLSQLGGLGLGLAGLFFGQGGRVPALGFAGGGRMPSGVGFDVGGAANDFRQMAARSGLTQNQINTRLAELNAHRAAPAPTPIPLGARGVVPPTTGGPLPPIAAPPRPSVPPVGGGGSGGQPPIIGGGPPPTGGPMPPPAGGGPLPVPQIPPGVPVPPYSSTPLPTPQINVPQFHVPQVDYSVGQSAYTNPLEQLSFNNAPKTTTLNPALMAILQKLVTQTGGGGGGSGGSSGGGSGGGGGGSGGGGSGGNGVGVGNGSSNMTVAEEQANEALSGGFGNGDPPQSYGSEQYLADWLHPETDISGAGPHFVNDISGFGAHKRGGKVGRAEGGGFAPFGGFFKNLLAPLGQKLRNGAGFGSMMQNAMAGGPGQDGGTSAPGLSPPQTVVPGKRRTPVNPLVNIGFAMMAGDSPYAGINIGKGALAGMQMTQDQRASLDEDAQKFEGPNGNWWIYYPGTGEKIDTSFPVIKEAKDVGPLESIIGPDGKTVILETRANSVGKTPATKSPDTVVNIGDNGATYGAPQPGYVWARNDKGEIATEPVAETNYRRPVQVPIKGGTVDTKQAEADAQAGAVASAAQGIANVVVEDVQRVIKQIEDFPFATTGIVGQTTQGIAGTPAFETAQLLNGVKANISFDKLQKMREASPTGGALGQVSDFENRLLQSVLGSLEIGQSKEQIVHNLSRVKDLYSGVAAIEIDIMSGKIKEAEALKRLVEIEKRVSSLAPKPTAKPDPLKLGF